MEIQPVQVQSPVVSATSIPAGQTFTYQDEVWFVLAAETVENGFVLPADSILAVRLTDGAASVFNSGYQVIKVSYQAVPL